MESPLAPVDRVERPSVGDFRRRYLRPSRPAVLLGVCDRWPARGWTADSLRARLGSSRVAPVVLDRGRFRIDLDEGVRVQAMRFDDYLDGLARAERPGHYLRLPLEGGFASLLDEVERPPYCVDRVAMKCNLWLGGEGTASDIHYDMTHNIVAQLRGRRRVTLFPPSEAPRLYPYSLRSLNWHHSQVRLEAPDEEAFPAFSRARRVVVALSPGECLFIPRGWWHHFEALEASLAVNFFWITPRHVPALALARVAWRLAGVAT